MTMTNNIAAMAVKYDNVTESIALELMVALARLGGDAPSAPSVTVIVHDVSDWRIYIYDCRIYKVLMYS